MHKTILITGSTDGIGYETAKRLAGQGHIVLLHGRSREKLAAVERQLAALPGAGPVETFVADFARMAEVEALADAIAARHGYFDILIHNAGVYRTSNTRTPDGLDMRFAVNTVAPYLLTQKLLPLMDGSGCVINLSSAAQAPVDLNALAGQVPISEDAAYAQSKLGLTMWSRALAQALGENGPAIIAVNPGSLLATKMVKEVYGSTRGDASVGARILAAAALSDEFAAASGQYFDNDEGRFAAPHPDAVDPAKNQDVIHAIEVVLARLAASPGVRED